MLEAFRKHINENFAELFHQKSLLAISGGIDSTVLAHLLKDCGLKFSLAHCNFNLRGEDANLDEQFVRALGKSWDITTHVINFDTNEYATEKKLSIQMAARELRYNWFEQLIYENEYNSLIVAHNLNDNAETVLINFTRGTAIDGLVGINEQNSLLKRVMMPFSRKEIHQYAIENNIEWREDKSNASTKYFRNKIRHKVLPVLEEINPSFLSSFDKSNNVLRQQFELFKDLIKQKSEEICFEKNDIFHIDINKLSSEKHSKALLSEILKDFGFREYIDDIFESINSHSGKIFQNNQYRLLKDRKYFLIDNIKKSTTSNFTLNVQNKNNTLSNKDITLKLSNLDSLDNITFTNKNLAYFDSDKVKLPLTLRKWKEGDKFTPFGMKGAKKVSKYLKDIKLTLFEKEKTYVLCSGEEIIWLVGHRTSEKHKIDSATKSVIKFEIE